MSGKMTVKQNKEMKIIFHWHSLWDSVGGRERASCFFPSYATELFAGSMSLICFNYYWPKRCTEPIRNVNQSKIMCSWDNRDWAHKQIPCRPKANRIYMARNGPVVCRYSLTVLDDIVLSFRFSCSLHYNSSTNRLFFLQFQLNDMLLRK